MVKGRQGMKAGLDSLWRWLGELECGLAVLGASSLHVELLLPKEPGSGQKGLRPVGFGKTWMNQ